ncbi:uncharacterized protein PAC_04997 [Phialocephala subalpina]|uniref:Major facilitator superfamily (MFS) profile domain-containing protein n=1 Tax=Phialocephala subalpina TaxID=576137 RepID=A0A1L7WQT3_9HELO|nr:uncharacterized protein PAC_04997 [Phialocephala subalpina]
MGFFTKTEDRSTSKEVYNFRVYFYAAVTSAGAATIGYDGAFIRGILALASFKKEFGLTLLPTHELNTISASIVSTYQAEAFFGAFAAYPVGHYLGRRISLGIFSLLFLFRARLMLGADTNRGLGLIYGGRAIAGSALVLSPISSLFTYQRFRHLLFEVDSLACGKLDSRALAPPGLLTIGTFFLVESPRWLIHNNQRKKGLATLARLRGLNQDHIYLREEIAQIDQAIELQASTIGINAINYYSPTVFASIGISGTNTSLLTRGIFGVIKTVMTFIWILAMIDQLGRRKLLIFGALGGSMALRVVGGYIAAA